MLVYYNAKTILQGTERGGRRQGREKTMWKDNIKEWTVLEVSDSQRTVKNKERYKELVKQVTHDVYRSWR